MKAVYLNLLEMMLFFKNTNIFGAEVTYTGVTNRTMSSPFSTKVISSRISCGISCHSEVDCLGFSFVEGSNTCKLYDKHPARPSADVTFSSGEDLFGK